jgi:hypothetical protein
MRQTFAGALGGILEKLCQPKLGVASRTACLAAELLGSSDSKRGRIRRQMGVRTEKSGSTWISSRSCRVAISWRSPQACLARSLRTGKYSTAPRSTLKGHSLRCRKKPMANAGNAGVTRASARLRTCGSCGLYGSCKQLPSKLQAAAPLQAAPLLAPLAAPASAGEVYRGNFKNLRLV